MSSKDEELAQNLIVYDYLNHKLEDKDDFDNYHLNPDNYEDFALPNTENNEIVQK